MRRRNIPFIVLLSAALALTVVEIVYTHTSFWGPVATLMTTLSWNTPGLDT